MFVTVRGGNFSKHGAMGGSALFSVIVYFASAIEEGLYSGAFISAFYRILSVSFVTMATITE